ncbi:MAG: hypothetical protein HKN69_14935 [Desulfofustis sp.]|nr:hypothetical protein [Desulfofustis sp.]
MSHPSTESHLKEAAILTRAVETVMRKFVRLLIGRMSLARLQELTRLVFVQEAEAFLKREKPGKNVAMTKLALLTGLDTRTLGKVRGERLHSISIADNEDFLRGFLPGFRVLDVWANDERFLDKHTGRPRRLPISGEGDSFEYLVTQALTSRGVTYKSIMDRLELNDFVSIDRTEQTISLQSENRAFIGRDQLDMIDMGFASVSHLLSTVAHNVSNAAHPDRRLFQRGSWSYKINKRDRLLFRRTMFSFLELLDSRVKGEIAAFEEKEKADNQFTAGISMYYFEDEIES